MNTPAAAMSSLESLFAQPLVNAIGWALVHFLWQGAALVAIVAVLLAGLRRASANLRYLVSCVALLVLACMPIVTAWCVYPQGPLRSTMMSERAENPPFPATVTDGATGGPLPHDFVELPAEPKSLPVSTAPLVNPSSPLERTQLARATDWIEHALPWLVAAWLVGVLCLSARLLAGWAHVQRIRRRHARPAAEPWPTRLAELARRLRVTRPVRLLESALVEVPTVIGWLRPVVLLPASAIVGLEPGQLEALLAHELAHIRRHDYLVNLFQTVIETLLFYQPAVWWVSHRIRAEREECCDELAVQICSSRLSYARALATMEELRTPQPNLALAASGGSLLRRVRRLLGCPVPTAYRPGWWLGGLITLALVVSLCLSVRISASAPGRTPTGAPLLSKLDGDTITGRVVDVSGRELGGVEVRVTSWRGAELRRTDSEGRVQVPRAWLDDDDGVRLLTVQAKDGSLGWFALSKRSRISDDPDTDAFRITVLPRTQTIHGTLVDSAGKPLQEVRVKVSSLQNELNGTADDMLPREAAAILGESTTDKRGQFSMNVPAETWWEVHTLHAGYIARRFWLHPEGNRDLGTVTLEPAGSIEGRVVHAGSGRPLAGVWLGVQALIPDYDTGSWGDTVSGADGSYCINGLKPGLYNVLFLRSPHDPKHTAPADDGVLVEVGQTATADLEVIEGVRLAGRVVDAATDNPVTDTSVACYGPARPRSGAACQATQTDARGEFHFYVPPGPHYVYLMLGDAVGPDRSRDVEIVRDNEPARVLLKLARGQGTEPAAATDVVKKAAPAERAVEHAAFIDGEGVSGVVIDPDGNPVADARVFYPGDPVRETTCNKKGEFQLGGFGRGASFSLLAYAKGYHVWSGWPESGQVLRIVLEPKRRHQAPPDEQTRTPESATAVRAATREHRAQVNLGTARIVGRLIDISGDPVAGAEIYALTREVRPAAISADDGRFQLEVPLQEVPGLVLRATRDGGDRQAFHQLAYEQNQPPEEVSIVLRPARQVTAAVLDAKNEPVAKSWVAVVSGYRKIAEATTDSTGKATLRVPADAPLQYALARKLGTGLDYFVYRRKDEPPSDPYKIPSDHGEPLRFVLNGTRSVTVRVLDSQQQPLVGVRVYPWYFEKPQKGGDLNCSGVEEFFSLSDSRGIATFPFVPADNTGNVTFWVDATAYFAPQRPMWDPKSGDDEVIASLVSKVKVRGNVSFSDGRPAADIEIKVAGSGYQVDGFHGSTRTTEDGEFEVLVYPNQFYSFLPVSDRWSAITQRMVVRESDRDGIVFVLQPATRVFGRLTIGADKPVARQFLVLYQSDYGDEYHKLPETERLPNPNDSRKAIMSLVGRNTNTDDDGRFEIFAGPGRYYIVGPNNIEAPKFEIGEQKQFEINLHASQPDRGEIAGRVVLQSDRSRGVREARVTGVPMQSRMRRLDAVTDSDGRFRAERGLSEMIVYAATADRKLAGIVKLSTDENSVEIPIGLTATAHGRLLDDATGVPLPDKHVEYGVFIKYDDGTFNWRFGGAATTDNLGEFSLTGLVVGWDYVLQVVTEFDSDGRLRSFSGAGTVSAERAELLEIGDIKFNSPARERRGPPRLKEPVPDDKSAAKESRKPLISPEKVAAAIDTAEPHPEADKNSAPAGGSKTRSTAGRDSEQLQPPAAQIPGRLFVNAGLRTAENETRFVQLAIAIDPNPGGWTRVQSLQADGFTVPISPVRVSPDGRTMLFMREKELWKCDARTGQRPERVLENGSPAAWAPDGKAFFAVVSKKESDFQAVENWKVNADGGDHSVLALPDADVVEDWSPDGQWLAVMSRKDSQLYVVKPDGSGRRRVTDTDTNASRNDHPRFSPDSRRMVYHRTLYVGEDGASESHFSLRTIHIDGTGDREILGETKAGSEPSSALRTAPMGARWSPDGKHLAVVLFDHDGKGILAINGNWRLAIIDADGGNLRELKLDGVLNTVLPWDGPEWRAVKTDPTGE